MKRNILLALTLGVFSAPNSYAVEGCLDSISTSQVITTKIRGFFVRPAEGGQFVIIDKATCVASGGATTLGSSTKNSYYLFYKDSDKALVSSMYMAYSKGDKVDFRIGEVSSVSGGYNPIAYAVIPAGARAQ